MKRPLLNGLAAAVCLCCGILFACQVPVFRYALERWKPGAWKIVVLSRGPLSQEHRKSLQQLAASASAHGPGHTPLQLEIVDLDTAANTDRRRWQFLDEINTSHLNPVVIALYPQPSAVERPTASLLALSPDTAGLILSSPVRSELAARLAAGHSAVWLFLESGHQTADQAAFERLTQQLEKDKKRLQLPKAADLQVSESLLQQLRVPFRLEFSTIRLQRDNPAEEFLVDSLLNSENDLRELQEPLAFPVFGRGRVLYALAGNGIAPETIAEASDFLAGPCSCQVKEQNPGFDLLLTHDWGKAIGTTLISSPLPEEKSRPRLLPVPPGRPDISKRKSGE